MRSPFFQLFTHSIFLMKKLIVALLFTALMAFFIGTLWSIPVAPLFAGLLFLGATVFRKMPGVTVMAITVEIWQNDIIANLFKGNEFAARAFSEDQFVIGGKIVHIPQAGAPSPSVKNLSSFPQNAVKRTDTDILYALDTYYQPPKFVEKVEQYELSYDKRQSIMGEQQNQLIQDAMDGLIYRWGRKSTSGAADSDISYLLTTGAATAEDILADATGTRKVFTKDVFGKVKKAFDKNNIPPTGRVALLTATHHQQLIDSFDSATQTNFYRSADMSRGVVGTYLGFEVMMRSSVQRWRKTAGVWALVDEQDAGFAASSKANDSAASLFYQDQAVGRARGEVNVFDSAGRPEYYGDVFSMNMRLGGRVRRPIGVTAVIEDIGA